MLKKLDCQGIVSEYVLNQKRNAISINISIGWWLIAKLVEAC
jgi:hypothetical protein